MFVELVAVSVREPGSVFMEGRILDASERLTIRLSTAPSEPEPHGEKEPRRRRRGSWGPASATVAAQPVNSAYSASIFASQSPTAAWSFVSHSSPYLATNQSFMPAVASWNIAFSAGVGT